MRSDWLNDAQWIEADVIRMRRHLHQYPEVSFQEEETSTYIYNKLVSYGLTDIQRNVGNGYGLVATIQGQGGTGGPVIALRADMDALPIKEEADYPFPSKKSGIMHACGHDGHTAILLGVAHLVQRKRAEFRGTVMFIFQHGEEVKPGGAKSIIATGLLDNVDEIYGLHVDPQLTVGQMSYSMDYGSAASDTIKIDVQGRSGHASRPQEAIDSIIIASEIITNLQTLVSRTVDPFKPAVLTFGSVQAGGTAKNIIADQALIHGTIRTFSEEVRLHLKRKLIQMTEAIVGMNDGEVVVTYQDGYPALLNTAELVKESVKVIKDKQVFDRVFELSPTLIGEDFAYYLQDIPGAFFHLGISDKGSKNNYPLHHPKFSINEASLLKGVQLFLAILLNKLEVV